MEPKPCGTDKSIRPTRSAAGFGTFASWLGERGRPWRLLARPSQSGARNPGVLWGFRNQADY